MAPILAGDEFLDLRPNAGQPAHPLASSTVCGAVLGAAPASVRRDLVVLSAVSGREKPEIDLVAPQVEAGLESR